jgi:hypothetical protein
LIFRLKCAGTFRQEVEDWLNKIQRLRMKPNRGPGSFKFYYDLLYDYPFCGVEIQNMRIILEFVTMRYDDIRPTKSPEETVASLESFHRTLAQRLAAGEAVLDLVPG